jgi:hypothetical protein
MKVYINKYRDHWLSPYTILEKVFFWREIDYDEPIIDKLSNILLPVCTTLQKVLNVIHPKINYVKIDKWDTWSMDHTLSYIILPMLKQLKETKHGAPFVDDEDVPEELKSTSAPPKENEWDTDGNHFKRWDHVLDEMIFAFEHKVDDDWENDFSSGEFDMKFVKCEDNPELSTMVEGPNHTYVTDYEGIRKIHERMKNGFRLFGKYYEGLWD